MRRDSNHTLNVPFLRIIAPRQYGQIRARHAQQSSIRHRLNGGIDEWGGGTVRVQIDDVYSIGFFSVSVEKGALRIRLG
jgi:hypothetical protein